MMPSQRIEEGLWPNLSYLYGAKMSGEAQYSTVDHQTPLLLLGESGTGKTSLLVSILRQIYDHNDARQVQVFFLDTDQQFAYLFEQQRQTAAIGISDEDSLEILDVFQQRIRSSMRFRPQSYSLLVIDGFLHHERLFPSILHILSLCDSPAIWAWFGVIVADWDVLERARGLFRTTFHFATPTNRGVGTHLLLPRQFFVTGPVRQRAETYKTPFIHYPSPGAQELFWMSIDRERFRERWKEPICE